MTPLLYWGVFCVKLLDAVFSFEKFVGIFVVGFSVYAGKGGVEGFGDGLVAIVDCQLTVRGDCSSQSWLAVRTSLPPAALRWVLG